MLGPGIRAAAFVTWMSEGMNHMEPVKVTAPAPSGSNTDTIVRESKP